MPVTRDLSGDKRKAILAWLENPLRGEPPVASAVPAKAPDNVSAPDELPGRGGKAAFYSRIQAGRKRH
jgi:hypothetical protein